MIGMEAVTTTIENIVVGTTAAASTEIQLEGFKAGQVAFKSGSLATITYHVAVKSSKNSFGATPTFNAAYNAAGNAITQVVATGRAYPIPTELFGAAAIKMVGDAAGVVDVCLKTG